MTLSHGTKITVHQTGCGNDGFLVGTGGGAAGPFIAPADIIGVCNNGILTATTDSTSVSDVTTIGCQSMLQSICPSK